MTPYDGHNHRPPAPVGRLRLETIDGATTVADIPALLDSGADATLLPRWAVEQLGLTPASDQTDTLAWFDGSIVTLETVEVYIYFLNGRFRGRFVVIDQPHGVIGRNLLNLFRLLLDGPAQTWFKV